MNLNLEKLGVTKESLINAVLAETGLTPEGAVIELAKTLGVEIMDARDYKPEPAPVTAIRSGDRVETDQGAAEALIMSDGDFAAVKGAVNVLYGRFCA